MIKTHIPIMRTFQAVQFTRDNWDEILEFTKGEAKDFAIIPKTLNGVATCAVPSVFGYIAVEEGEYIIKTSKRNHFIRISEANFVTNYKEVEKITDG